MIIDTINNKLVSATSDTVGAFPIRDDITVLPADDPRKLRLGFYVMESPWTCCTGFGETCWVHIDKDICVYVGDMQSLADAYELGVETFSRLLRNGSLDADLVGFWLERIREKRVKTEKKDDN